MIEFLFADPEQVKGGRVLGRKTASRLQFQPGSRITAKLKQHTAAVVAHLGGARLQANPLGEGCQRTFEVRLIG